MQERFPFPLPLPPSFSYLLFPRPIYSLLSPSPSSSPPLSSSYLLLTLFLPFFFSSSFLLLSTPSSLSPSSSSSSSSSFPLLLHPVPFPPQPSHPIALDLSAQARWRQGISQGHDLSRRLPYPLAFPSPPPPTSTKEVEPVGHRQETLAGLEAVRGGA